MPIWLFKGMRRDTGPRAVTVHSCQLSMSSCSKVPEGLNPLMAPKRMISLISAGAVLSQKAQAVTSTLSGPWGATRGRCAILPAAWRSWGRW